MIRNLLISGPHPVRAVQKDQRPKGRI